MDKFLTKMWLSQQTNFIGTTEPKTKTKRRQPDQASEVPRPPISALPRTRQVAKILSTDSLFHSKETSDEKE